jgi:hypothetical protein
MTVEKLRGSEDDAEFRRERARRAARASHSTDAVVRRFVRRIPDLTPEQIETVRRALARPIGVDADE